MLFSISIKSSRLAAVAGCVVRVICTAVRLFSGYNCVIVVFCVLCELGKEFSGAKTCLCPLKSPRGPSWTVYRPTSAIEKLILGGILLARARSLKDERAPSG